MRRWLPVVLVLTILLVSSLPVRAEAAVNIVNTKQGSVQVTLGTVPVAKIKILVEKDNMRYFYNLNRHQESFPLQMGNGSYQVHVLEQIEGNKYKFVHSEEFAVRLPEKEMVFLNSVQNVPWEQAPQAVAKAQELTNKADLDEDKLKLIYDFIINNITYDYEKAKKLPSDYLPDPDQAFRSRKGICYDYASLFASMLRSVGVPSKLVMGNADDVTDYHAWNEVFIGGKWLIIDTTVDARLREADKPYAMIKDIKAYKTTRIY
ncbi:MAG TPA: transglutaminase domain-containing protein [Firmicutes bacterium]|jgi:hypothetical protein|nr:transglutaminase domain-containing protein [Bacillota bacterium]